MPAPPPPKLPSHPAAVEHHLLTFVRLTASVIRVRDFVTARHLRTPVSSQGGGMICTAPRTIRMSQREAAR